MKYGDALQLDHIVPLRLGGSVYADNARIVHGKCNRERGARLGRDLAVAGYRAALPPDNGVPAVRSRQW
jgi:5-methylcytosine-specific restriction endonuclease McrA